MQPDDNPQILYDEAKDPKSNLYSTIQEEGTTVPATLKRQIIRYVMPEQKVWRRDGYGEGGNEASCFFYSKPDPAHRRVSGYPCTVYIDAVYSSVHDYYFTFSDTTSHDHIQQFWKVIKYS